MTPVSAFFTPNRQRLLDDLRAYVPFNALEADDRNAIVRFISQNPDAFERLHDETSPDCGHITACAWVVDETFQHVLMNHVVIYDRWLPFGGHADGDDDVFHVAGKELEEEGGISASTLRPGIWDVRVINVEAHMRKGVLVPAHKHFDILYLSVVNRNTPLTMSDESKELRWFTLAEAAAQANISSRIPRLLEKTALLQRAA